MASFDFDILLENAPSKVLVDSLMFVCILLFFNPKLFPHQLNYLSSKSFSTKKQLYLVQWVLDSPIHAFDIRVVHCNFFQEEPYLILKTHDGIIHWVCNSVIHLLNLYPISSPDLGCTLIQAVLPAFFLWHSD